MSKSTKSVVLSKEDYAKFRVFLKENKINYEPSGYGNQVYISCMIDEKETEMCNAFLSTL